MKTELKIIEMRKPEYYLTKQVGELTWGMAFDMIKQAQKDALLEAIKCVYPLDPHSKIDEVHCEDIKQNIRKLMK